MAAGIIIIVEGLAFGPSHYLHSRAQQAKTKPNQASKDFPIERENCGISKVSFFVVHLFHFFERALHTGLV